MITLFSIVIVNSKLTKAYHKFTIDSLFLFRNKYQETRQCLAPMYAPATEAARHVIYSINNYNFVSYRVLYHSYKSYSNKGLPLIRSSRLILDRFLS